MSDIDALTKALIETQVLHALKSTPDYIDDLIRGVLEGEVNPKGQKPEAWASKSDTMPWLTWCVQDTIRDAVKVTVIRMLKEMEPQFEEHVRSALSSNEIVKSFTKSIIDGVHDFNVNVTIEKSIS